MAAQRARDVFSYLGPVPGGALTVPDMTWFRRRPAETAPADAHPAGARVLVSSPDGPVTRWPGRTLAGRTFAAVDGTGMPEERTWPRPGLTIGGRRLPGILVPSMTDLFVAKARSKPPGDGGPAMFLAQHDFLAGTELDQPSYLGVGARATIFLNLGSGRCRGLKRLGGALRSDESRLYVQAHRAGDYGFLRLSLSLSGLVHDFDTAVSPIEGNIQEFLAVACQTGVIELHISRESSTEWLSCACSAEAVRNVTDRALTDLSGAEFPARPAEQETFNAGLRAAMLAVNDRLAPSAAIPLSVIGEAPPYLALEVTI